MFEWILNGGSVFIPPYVGTDYPPLPEGGRYILKQTFSDGIGLYGTYNSLSSDGKVIMAVGTSPDALYRYDLDLSDNYVMTERRPVAVRYPTVTGDGRLIHSFANTVTVESADGVDVNTFNVAGNRELVVSESGTLMVKGGNLMQLEDVSTISLKYTIPGGDRNTSTLSGDGSTILSMYAPSSTVSGPITISVYRDDGEGYKLVQHLLEGGSNMFGLFLSVTDDGGIVAYGMHNVGGVAVFQRQVDGSYVKTQTLSGPSYFGHDLNFSHDGGILVVGAYSSSSYFVFRLMADGQYELLQTLTGPQYFGRDPVISKDGRTVVVGSGSQVRSIHVYRYE